ncbi:hypothetical protein OsJ_32795 [Oryza sativa Japonica Group]|uniref:Uncharacterized protein n=1 Tax=Oryza sativa subsp. japonica TaxID=39947 RepID=A3C863_ORYSJ|nr:hypothetical protein OsJ_32795 [Oryza sativa Japonica Group]
MATDAYPVQLLHRQATAATGGGQWHNLGAAYAAVRFLRPQGRSLVLYAGPDGGAQQRIVFAYPIFPGDAFERMDGETLSWANPDCGDEFALCFLDEAACAAVSGAISPVTESLAALDGLRREARRAARGEGGGWPRRGGHRRPACCDQHRPTMNRPPLT